MKKETLSLQELSRWFFKVIYTNYFPSLRNINQAYLSIGIAKGHYPLMAMPKMTLDHQHVKAWLLLMRLVHINGRLQQACAILNEALESLPEDPALLALKAELWQ